MMHEGIHYMVFVATMIIALLLQRQVKEPQVLMISIELTYRCSYFHKCNFGANGDGHER